tara:strand:- start:462 stop:644 length:183 start_codon:yes stop_codon:yes gene_type:complete
MQRTPWNSKIALSVTLQNKSIVKENAMVYQMMFRHFSFPEVERREMSPQTLMCDLDPLVQ